MSTAYIQIHPRLSFITEVNIMNPDQTDQEQSDLGPHCLQYTTKVHEATREQATIVVIGRDKI